MPIRNFLTICTKLRPKNSTKLSALKLQATHGLKNLKTVVTIPENLLLSDSEKSVLSKGLNFVPIPKKKTDEFLVKQDVEKFLRRVQLKAFFHDKEDDSNVSNEDTFETLQVREFKWTLLGGQFANLNSIVKKVKKTFSD